MCERQLLVFWQFNGTNKSFCNYHCPYCYGKRNKNYLHLWNGRIDDWEKAFERLNRDIYFVFSYGEAFGSHGFYECVDMIGRHPNWTLNIITNLSYSPSRLIASRLGKEKRVFVTASWHPLGAPDSIKAWKRFKKHLLMLRDAGIPVHVMYLWYKPQIKLFRECFLWLDKNGFRFTVRRYAKTKHPYLSKVLRNVLPKQFAGKIELEDYSEAEKALLCLCNDAKVKKYTIDMTSVYGLSCSAGKDMILAACNGDVKLCADCVGANHCLGNIFDENFKLNKENVKCPINVCGGHYGMLHLVDAEFGSLPDKLWDDTFVSQVEDKPVNAPVKYDREEILEWLKVIENEG